MPKSGSGRPSNGPEVSSSRSGRRRKEDEKEGTLSRGADSVTSASSRRKSSRRDETESEVAFQPTSTSFSSFSQSPYAGVAAPSVASSYATAYTNEPTTAPVQPPDLVRNESVADKVPTSERKESTRDRKRQSKGETSRALNDSDDESRNARRRERDEQRRSSKKSDVSRRESARGNTDENHNASLVQNQFPGEFPSTFAEPYRPPGQAAEYYADHGESVQYQPGVRPQPPSIIQTADQAHLYEPTIEAKPPPEPSSLGLVGAAASFFGTGNDSDHGNTSTPSRPPRRESLKPVGQEQMDTSASPRSSPGSEGRIRPTNMPSRGGIAPMGSAAMAVGAGLAADYYTGNNPMTSPNSAPVESSGHVGQGYAQSETTYHTAQSQTTYNMAQTFSTPQRPSARPSANSNMPLYGAAAAAGLAGAAAASAYHSNHNHSDQPQFSQGQTGSNSVVGQDQSAFPAMQQQQQRHRHNHRGPLGKMVDWFRDPQAVAEYEQYTEAIGVCKYCFDPKSSPMDAPRRHNYNGQRYSGSRFGSNTRVDKLTRYSSDEERRRRSTTKKVIAGGLAAAGAAKIGETLYNQRNDFDDTYSVKSGQPNNRSRVSFKEDEKRYSSRRKKYSDTEEVRVSLNDSRRKSKNDGEVYEKRSSRRRDSSASNNMSRGAALSTGIAAAGAAGAGIAAAESGRRRRSRSRSKSPTKKKYYSKRISPRHSYVDLSKTESGPLTFGSFFSSPSANKRKGKKQKGFFNFANGSSSSSDADLVFGEGTVRRKDSKRKDKRKADGNDATAAILGLAATGAALAAESGRRESKGKRKSDAAAGRESKKPSKRADRINLQDHESDAVHEGVWEDTLGDELSADSALAYGGRLSARQSRESLNSNSGTSKWDWRWNKKKDEKEKETETERKRKGSSRPDSSNFHPIAAGLVGAAAGAAVSSMVQSPAVASTPSLPPMRYVDVVATTDPTMFDARTSSIVNGVSPKSSAAVVSSRPVPLQQPQPITPISQNVYDSPQFSSTPSGPTVFDRDSKSARITESPKQILADVSPPFSEPNRRSQRRRDSSPATLPSRSNVNFDLTEEQLDQEKRAQDRKRRTTRREDRQRRKSKEVERVDAALLPETKSEETSRPSVDRRTSGDVRMAREAEIEAELQRLYDEDRRQSEDRKRRNEVAGVAATAAIGTGIAAAAIIERSHYSSEEEEKQREDRRKQRRSSLKKSSRDRDVSASESQQERIARMAAQRVRSTPSPVHEDYSSFFVPPELANDLSEHNFKSEHRDDHARDAAHVVEIVPRSPTGKKETWYDPLNYRPFGLEPEDNPMLYPWPVPQLELIEPSPPASRAMSAMDERSPYMEPKKMEDEPEVRDVDLEEIVPSSVSSKKSRRSSVGSRVTWGDHEINVYEVQTPEWEMSGNVFDTDGGLAKVQTTHNDDGEQSKETLTHVPPVEDMTKEQREHVSMGKDFKDLPPSQDEQEVRPEPTPIVEEGKPASTKKPDSGNKFGFAAAVAAAAAVRGSDRDVTTEDAPQFQPEPPHGLVSERPSYQSPFAESTVDLGVVPDFSTVPPRGPGFVEDQEVPATTRNENVIADGFDTSINPDFRESNDADGIVSPTRLSRSEARRQERAAAKFAAEIPLPESILEQQSITEPEERAASKSIWEKSPSASVVGFGSTTETKAPGGFNVFDYLIDEKSTIPTASVMGMAALGAKEAAEKARKRAKPNSEARVPREEQSRQKDIEPEAEDFAKQTRAETFNESEFVDEYASASQTPKSKSGYSSDPEDWEKSSSAKKSKRKSSSSSSKRDNDFLEKAVIVGAASIATAPMLDDFYEGKKSKRKSKDDSDIFDDDAKSNASSPATFKGDRQDLRKSERKSKRNSKSFDDDTKSVTSSTTVDDKESKRKSKDSGSSKKSSGGFFGLFSSSKSDVSNSSRKAKSTVSENGERKKRSSKDKDADFDDAATMTSERRRSRSASQSSVKAPVREESVDDGFVSAKEIVDVKNGNNKLGSEEEQVSFLAQRPEMLAPMAESKSMPMGTDGASGLTEGEKHHPVGLLEAIRVSQIGRGMTKPAAEPTHSIVESAINAPVLERDRSVSPRTSIDAADSIPDSYATRDSPLTGQEVRPRRLSNLRTSGLASSPITTSSPTAVPLNFRRLPMSPAKPRTGSFGASTSPASSPLATPRTRQGRPASTDFRTSIKEFRPLYLVERHSSAKQPTPEVEETYPSLPSSRTTSAHPSTENLRGDYDQDENQGQSQGNYFLPAERITPELFRDRSRRQSFPSYWHEGRERPRSSDDDYLDSGQATPTAKSPGLAKEMGKEKPKYEFHSPSELLQDPSQFDADDEPAFASPLPSVVGTEDYVSATSRSRSVSPASRRGSSLGVEATLGVLGGTAAVLAGSQVFKDRGESDEMEYGLPSAIQIPGVPSPPRARENDFDIMQPASREINYPSASQDTPNDFALQSVSSSSKKSKKSKKDNKDKAKRVDFLPLLATSSTAVRELLDESDQEPLTALPAIVAEPDAQKVQQATESNTDELRAKGPPIGEPLAEKDGLREVDALKAESLEPTLSTVVDDTDLAASLDETKDRSSLPFSEHVDSESLLPANVDRDVTHGDGPPTREKRHDSFVPSFDEVNQPENEHSAFEEAFERAAKSRGLSGSTTREEALAGFLPQRGIAAVVEDESLTPIGEMSKRPSPVDTLMEEVQVQESEQEAVKTAVKGKKGKGEKKREKKKGGIKLRDVVGEGDEGAEAGETIADRKIEDDAVESSTAGLLSATTAGIATAATVVAAPELLSLEQDRKPFVANSENEFSEAREDEPVTKQRDGLFSENVRVPQQYKNPFGDDFEVEQDETEQSKDFVQEPEQNDPEQDNQDMLEEVKQLVPEKSEELAQELEAEEAGEPANEFAWAPTSKKDKKKKRKSETSALTSGVSTPISEELPSVIESQTSEDAAAWQPKDVVDDFTTPSSRKGKKSKKKSKVLDWEDKVQPDVMEASRSETALGEGVVTEPEEALQPAENTGNEHERPTIEQPAETASEDLVPLNEPQLYQAKNDFDESALPSGKKGKKNKKKSRGLDWEDPSEFTTPEVTAELSIEASRDDTEDKAGGPSETTVFDEPQSFVEDQTMSQQDDADSFSTASSKKAKKTKKKGKVLDWEGAAEVTAPVATATAAFDAIRDTPQQGDKQDERPTSKSLKKDKKRKGKKGSIIVPEEEPEFEGEVVSEPALDVPLEGAAHSYEHDDAHADWLGQAGKMADDFPREGAVHHVEHDRQAEPAGHIDSESSLHHEYEHDGAHLDWLDEAGKMADKFPAKGAEFPVEFKGDEPEADQYAHDPTHHSWLGTAAEMATAFPARLSGKTEVVGQKNIADLETDKNAHDEAAQARLGQAGNTAAEFPDAQSREKQAEVEDTAGSAQHNYAHDEAHQQWLEQAHQASSSFPDAHATRSQDAPKIAFENPDEAVPASRITEQPPVEIAMVEADPEAQEEQKDEFALTTGKKAKKDKKKSKNRTSTFDETSEVPTLTGTTRDFEDGAAEKATKDDYSVATAGTGASATAALDAESATSTPFETPIEQAEGFAWPSTKKGKKDKKKRKALAWADEEASTTPASEAAELAEPSILPETEKSAEFAEDMTEEPGQSVDKAIADKSAMPDDQAEDQRNMTSDYPEESGGPLEDIALTPSSKKKDKKGKKKRQSQFDLEDPVKPIAQDFETSITVAVAETNLKSSPTEEALRKVEIRASSEEPSDLIKEAARQETTQASPVSEHQSVQPDLEMTDSAPVEESRQLHNTASSEAEPQPPLEESVRSKLTGEVPSVVEDDQGDTVTWVPSTKKRGKKDKKERASTLREDEPSTSTTPLEESSMPTTPAIERDEPEIMELSQPRDTEETGTREKVAPTSTIEEQNRDPWAPTLKKKGKKDKKKRAFAFEEESVESSLPLEGPFVPATPAVQENKRELVAPSQFKEADEPGVIGEATPVVEEDEQTFTPSKSKKDLVRDEVQTSSRDEAGSADGTSLARDPEEPSNELAGGLMLSDGPLHANNHTARGRADDEDFFHEIEEPQHNDHDVFEDAHGGAEITESREATSDMSNEHQQSQVHTGEVASSADALAFTERGPAALAESDVTKELAGNEATTAEQESQTPLEPEADEWALTTNKSRKDKKKKRESTRKEHDIVPEALAAALVAGGASVAFAEDKDSSTDASRNISHPGASAVQTLAPIDTPADFVIPSNSVAEDDGDGGLPTKKGKKDKRAKRQSITNDSTPADDAMGAIDDGQPMQKAKHDVKDDTEEDQQSQQEPESFVSASREPDFERPGFPVDQYHETSAVADQTGPDPAEGVWAVPSKKSKKEKKKRQSTANTPRSSRPDVDALLTEAEEVESGRHLPISEETQNRQTEDVAMADEPTDRDVAEEPFQEPIMQNDDSNFREQQFEVPAEEVWGFSTKSKKDKKKKKQSALDDRAVSSSGVNTPAENIQPEIFPAPVAEDFALDPAPIETSRDIEEPTQPVEDGLWSVDKKKSKKDKRSKRQSTFDNFEPIESQAMTPLEEQFVPPMSSAGEERNFGEEEAPLENLRNIAPVAKLPVAAESAGPEEEEYAMANKKSGKDKEKSKHQSTFNNFDTAESQPMEPPQEPYMRTASKEVSGMDKEQALLAETRDISSVKELSTSGQYAGTEDEAYVVGSKKSKKDKKKRKTLLAWDGAEDESSMTQSIGSETPAGREEDELVVPSRHESEALARGHNSFGSSEQRDIEFGGPDIVREPSDYMGGDNQASSAHGMPGGFEGNENREMLVDEPEERRPMIESFETPVLAVEEEEQGVRRKKSKKGKRSRIDEPFAEEVVEETPEEQILEPAGEREVEDGRAVPGKKSKKGKKSRSDEAIARDPVEDTTPETLAQPAEDREVEAERAVLGKMSKKGKKEKREKTKSYSRDVAEGDETAETPRQTEESFDPAERTEIHNAHDFVEQSPIEERRQYDMEGEKRSQTPPSEAASSRERRRRRRSPIVWDGEEPADMPGSRSLTPPAEDNSLMDTALSVAAGLGLTGAAIGAAHTHNRDHNKESQHPVLPEEAHAKTKNHEAADWSFAKLGSTTQNLTEKTQSRDSGVQFADSPTLPHERFQPLRDSGYVPSPIGHSSWQEPEGQALDEAHAARRRPQSPTSSSEDLRQGLHQGDDGPSRFPQHQPHQSQDAYAAHEHSRNVLDTPGKRQPSPVDSTTKDRSSTLFDSSPSTHADGYGTTPKLDTRHLPAPVTDIHRSPSIHGHHRSREQLRAISPSPGTSRAIGSDHQSGPHRSTDFASHQEQSPSYFSPRHSRELSKNRPYSPLKTPLGAIHEHAPELQPSQRRQRDVSDVGGPDRHNSVDQEKPEHDLGTAAALTGLAGVGAVAAAGVIGSSRDATAITRTKSLGRRKSRTTSSRQLRSQFDPNNIASSSSHSLVDDKGKGAARGMADDVFDGYGEHPGSPMSPTRPPSVRKRQSMQQITDLEIRLNQLADENKALVEAKFAAERHLDDFHHERSQSDYATQESLQAANVQLREKDEDILKLRQGLDALQQEVARLTEANKELTVTQETIHADHDQRYSVLRDQHDDTHASWQDTSRELDTLKTRHAELSTGMEEIVRHELDTRMAEKNAEIEKLQDELEDAKDKIRDLQEQILTTQTDDVIIGHDEDYFDNSCQQLCQHVQQWVLRFSKFSDTRICRLTNEVRDEKVVDRFDNAILDGSDVDGYLGDRVKRRDVFMSVVMTMIWEFIFTRYLFGMDREQRQKLKQLEKNLSEVGSPSAVHQWRAMTLTLLSKREVFKDQRESDTEAVAIEIFNTLSRFLPPPTNLEKQIKDSLRNVMRAAVDLSIEMRTQRAEYIMLPPLQPEYDTNGDLARKVYFNASLMNERSGQTTSNEELEASEAVVRIVLFPLVVKKGGFGDDGEWAGDEEVVVCPAQVLVARADADVLKGKRAVSVAERMSVEQAASLRAASRGSAQSFVSNGNGRMSAVDTGMGNMI